MREIKFRAWSTADNEMFYDVYFDNLEVWIWNDTETEIIGDILPNTMLKQAHLMQFTGLLDKHGKEIYEGDVLRNPSGHTFEITWGIPGETYVGWIIKWLDHPNPPMNWDLLFGRVSISCEVIGNIYEKGD